MWLAIEIRRARSDRNSNNAAKLYGYPYFTFYLEEIFCAHISCFLGYPYTQEDDIKNELRWIQYKNSVNWSVGQLDYE